MHVSSVHIAGVGISIDKTISENLSVVTGTKALLDAGLTYSDIDLSVTCPQIPRSCLRAFGRQGGSTIEADNDSALVTAVQYIRSGSSHCVLILGYDQEQSSGRDKARTAGVAIVLVSQRFLTSRAYLKDSAIQVSACSFAHQSRVAGHDTSYNAKRTITTALEQAKVGVEGFHMSIVQQTSDSNVQQVLSSMKGGTPTKSRSLPNAFEGTTGLAGLCGLVWQLRGWTQEQSSPTTKLKNCLQYTSRSDKSDSVLILCRSDSQAAPSWDEIEHLRDGRERLAYNPAVEMRDITLEDLQAVVAREGDRLEDSAPRLKLPRKGGDRIALARL